MADGTQKKDGTPLFLVPVPYPIRASVVRQVLLDLETKDKPGLVPEECVARMAYRFQEFFGDPTCSADLQQKLDKLKEKAIKRRGDSAVGWIDCNKDKGLVFELFTAKLRLPERIFFTIDGGETESTFSRFMSIFLMITIVVSIVNWMVSTIPENREIPAGCISIEPTECEPQALKGFKLTEDVTIYIFTFEFIIKFCMAAFVRFELASTDYIQGFFRSTCQTGKISNLDNPVVTFGKWLSSASTIIDVLAVAPYWFEKIAGGSGGSFFVVLRILRLTRIFRVFKLGKYNEEFSLFGRVMTQSQPALYLMLFFITLGMCLFGSLMWFTELGDWYPSGHPELEAQGIIGRGTYLRDVSVTSAAVVLEETPFASIPHAFWFVIVTITTAGYGDMYPTTGQGKFVGTLTILSGIIVLAMPVGVIGANFSQEYNRVQADILKRKKVKKQEEAEAQVRKQLRLSKYELGDLHEGDEDEDDVALSEDDDDVVLSEDLVIMNSLIDKATLIENEIMELLPLQSANRVQYDLRCFTRELLNSRDVPTARDLRVSLDELLFGAFAHIRSCLNYSPGYEPAPADLLDCRRHFIEFSEGCWHYWQEHPPVYEGLHEIFEMKARMMTQLQYCKPPPPLSPKDPVANLPGTVNLPGTPEAIG